MGLSQNIFVFARELRCVIGLKSQDQKNCLDGHWRTKRQRADIAARSAKIALLEKRLADPRGIDGAYFLQQITSGTIDRHAEEEGFLPAEEIPENDEPAMPECSVLLCKTCKSWRATLMAQNCGHLIACVSCALPSTCLWEGCDKPIGSWSRIG